MTEAPGSWTAWGEWQSCSVSCAGGTHTRTRSCEGGTDCQGDNTQEQRCDTQSCPTTSMYLFYSESGQGRGGALPYDFCKKKMSSGPS